MSSPPVLPVAVTNSTTRALLFRNNSTVAESPSSFPNVVLNDAAFTPLSDNQLAAPYSPPAAAINRSTLTALCVGIGLGGFIVLIGVGVCYFFYRRNKLKHEIQLPTTDTSRKDNWQQSIHQPPDMRGASFGKPPIQAKTAHDIQTPMVPISSLPVPNSTSCSLGSEKRPSGQSLDVGVSDSTFAYEELAMATDNFSSSKLLGQGGFGYVHKGVLPTGKDIAVKQLKTESCQGEREFQAEVETISRVHHRHLVSLVGYCIAGDERLLVYEYVPNGTLEYHVHSKGNPPMSWEERLRIAVGAAKGLAYLHEDCRPKIIHRDIKASNILIDEHFEAKVADFGLAKFSYDTDTHVSTRVMGTFGYMAPEYASSGKLTEKSDIFSFGVVLLELITGRRPIDKAASFMDDSMVEWARPLLTRALELGIYEGLVDPKLKHYNASEMTQMVACAAVCVRNSARRRPQMSQIVRTLEGNISVDDLFKETSSCRSTICGSSDFDSGQTTKEELKKFRKLAFESGEQSTSEISAVASEHGAQVSTSSSQSQDIQQSELGKSKKDAEEHEIPIL